jgi:predicted DNA-binding transcriptional regulator AlpA
MSKRILLTWRELKDAGWPYSRTHTGRLFRAGKFPAPVKLFPHRNAHPVWVYEEVLDWFKKRSDERNVLVKIEAIH